MKKNKYNIGDRFWDFKLEMFEVIDMELGCLEIDGEDSDGWFYVIRYPDHPIYCPKVSERMLDDVIDDDWSAINRKKEN